MKNLITALLFIIIVGDTMSKIILPHKLRYLENMLSADAKAMKLRQRIEGNSNVIDKEWPMLLAKYQEDMKYKRASYDSLYNRRLPNF